MKPLHYRYTIDVDALGYVQIMQLVMKYGSGTGHGANTAVTTRIALAEAKVRVDEGAANE